MKTELAKMKLLLAQSLHEIETSKEERRKTCSTIIDGNFLSTIFLVTFVGIIAVSFYAFRNLYFAVLKKFPSPAKDEL